MTRIHSRGLVLGILTAVLAIGGCRANAATDEELTQLTCSAVSPREPHRVGDAPILHGFIVSRGSELGFRPCNSSDTYFIRASVTLWDTLESNSPAEVGADPIYLRFHGVELECTSAIPEPWVGGVRIDEILAAGTAAPGNCE